MNTYLSDIPNLKANKSSIIQKGITRRLGFQKRILDLLAFKLGMSDK
jgi:hypothetical protein